MAVKTAINFEAEVTKLFALFDRLDLDAIMALTADDAQGVDEIARSWVRGRTAMIRYFDQLSDMGVGDIHSALRDFDVKHWDDVALVTCIVDQSYSIGDDGEMISIISPVSVLFRKIGNDWKVELIHSVPLPEEN